MLTLLATVAVLLQPPAVADSQPPAIALPFGELAQQVRETHPGARQADLLVEQAQAAQRAARGAFDPKVTASRSTKTFGQSEYYDYTTAKLSVPTPLGPDLTVSYERADGQYINPALRTPDQGLLSFGVSIPLGQRLLTDERRTGLQVAAAGRVLADAEQTVALNTLLLGAARDYAKWYETWRRHQVALEGLELARFRLDAVRGRVRAGDAPGIDTVEALLELQRRRVTEAEAAQSLLAARLGVEAYLWSERGQPLSLPPAAVPQVDGALAAAADPELVARLARLTEHPLVQRAEARAAQTVAQRRLASQQLIPLVTADVGALSARDAGLPFGSLPSGATGRKIEFDATSSLLFLKERGTLGVAEAREEVAELDVARVRRDVAIRVQQLTAEAEMVTQLLALQDTTLANARQLRDGELRRFEGGESTLFLVNSRDRAVLDEALRLAALEARRFAIQAELRAAAGLAP